MKRVQGVIILILLAGLLPNIAAAQIQPAHAVIETYHSILYTVTLNTDGTYLGTVATTYNSESTTTTEAYSFSSVPFLSFTEDRTGLLLNINEGLPAEVEDFTFNVVLPEHKGGKQGMAVSAFLPGAATQATRIIDGQHVSLHASHVATSTPIVFVVRWPKGIIKSAVPEQTSYLTRALIVLATFLIIIWAVSIPAYYMNKKKIDEFIHEMNLPRDTTWDK